MSSAELYCEPHSQNLKLRIVSLIARLRTVFSNVDLYKRLLGCRKSDAQILLDSFQRLLDTQNLDLPFRKSLIVATQRISTRSGLYPACYELKDVIHGSQHPINGGGFADIYKGDFQGQSVCLKTIRLYQDTQIEYILKQMSKEAILWGQLTHPNVLEFYGLFRFQDRLCLVSPWMENGDIRTYLKDKPATPRLPLTVDVANGLLYLHENGIIHGDLKAGNILVDGAGRARLADFGISAVSDSNIVAWTSQSSGASRGGSVRWQAPELFDIENGEAVKNSAASDVYAWGCAAFELFTGNVPFANIPRDTAIILYVKSGGRPIRPPPSSPAWMAWGLTEEMWLLIEQSWQSQPVQRPTSAKIIERLRTMLSSDIQLISGSSMLTPETFRCEMNASLELPTVEAFNLVLDSAPDIDYNDEFESTVFVPHNSAGSEAFNIGQNEALGTSASSWNGVDQNPPINTLYVGNLPTSSPPIGFPQNYLEESLRDLFLGRAGFRMLRFRQRSNGPLCFVEFVDVPCATKALNELYGDTLNGLVKGGIRLSYSKGGFRLPYIKNPTGVRSLMSVGSSMRSPQQQQMQPNNGGPPPPSVSARKKFISRKEKQQSRLPSMILLRGSSAVSPPPPSIDIVNSRLHVSSHATPRYTTDDR